MILLFLTVITFLVPGPSHAFYSYLQNNEKECFHVYPTTSGLLRLQVDYAPIDPHGVLRVTSTVKRLKAGIFKTPPPSVSQGFHLTTGSFRVQLPRVSADNPLEYCFLYTQTSTGDNVSAAARPLRVEMNATVFRNDPQLMEDEQRAHADLSVDPDEYMRALGRSANTVDQLRNEARRLMANGVAFDEMATTTYLAVIAMFVVKTLTLAIIVGYQLVKLEELIDAKRSK